MSHGRKRLRLGPKEWKYVIVLALTNCNTSHKTFIVIVTSLVKLKKKNFFFFQDLREQSIKTNQ